MDSGTPKNVEPRNAGVDALIKRIDWFLKAMTAITLFLGVLYAFLWRENLFLKIIFLASFLLSMNTAAVGALLVAFRELKRRRAIGTVLFFGSFGTIVIIVSSFLVKVLFLTTRAP
jgi:hypothetical protein